MRDEDVLQILNEFSDYLEIGNILTYCLRWLGWMVIQGLAWFVDGLEGITDTMLGLKAFYHSEGIQDFVSSIRPFLYIILAFSFLYIGYMMIMNRKMNREQMITNLFISIAVLVLLGTGMSKADKFTDDAVSFIKSENGGQSTISERIIKDGFIDVAQFDVNKWKSTNLEQDQRNKIPQEKIKMIDITEKIGRDYKVSKDKSLSEAGKEVFNNKVILSSVGEESLVQLENGWFDFFPESYYRWYWDFWTISISLFVIGMTLLLISIKLAKLCYELGFNYILATLLAPADIATGQRLKQVLINILNTFFVIIIIFISMKVYLLGTSFINDNFDGMAYLIALIAISLAVIDGPVMCERIFGIDAGLKSGWGMLVGGYALGKGIGGVAGKIGKGLGGLGKKGASSALAAGAGAAGLVVGLKGTGEKGIGDRKETLQDTMEADKDKKGNSQKAGGNKGSLDKSSDTSAGSAVSLHDEMKAKENMTGANSASTGPTITVGKFHDEMKMAGYAQGTNSSGAEFNMQAASKTAISTGTSLSASSFHPNASQSGGTLQKEMQAAGFRQEAAKNAGHAAGDTLQQSMNESRQESATSAESASGGGVQHGVSATHQESVASDAGSVLSDGLQQSISEAHQEFVESAGSAPSDGVQQGVSAARQEPVANAESAPSEGLLPSMSVAHQGSASSAARQESAISAGSTSDGIVQQSVSSTGQEVANPSYQETVASIQVDNSPTSISKTPMPVNQQRTETRTIGQYVVDSVKSSLNRSKSIQRTRRVYQLARNTGENWRSMVEKNRKKEE